MKKYYLFLLLPLVVRSQDVTIAPGASLALTGNALVTIQDGGLTNNGSFSAGNGTIMFSGTAATASSSIGGSSITIFNHLTINKSSNDVLLNNNVTVNGNLTMMSGNLQLNTYTVDLGSGAGTIVGETGSSRITGLAGGTVNKTASLNAPAAANPGNIGVEITSAANLGSTLIKRGHVQQTSSAGGLSVDRYFDITPANNSALNANLKFYYFDNELAGRNKPELTQWESSDGGIHWSYLGQDQLDNTNDWVLKNSIATFSRITLASNITNPLPIRLLSFTGALVNGETHLNWSTTQEQDNDHFDLERAPGNMNFAKLATIMSQGNSNTVASYKYIDVSPFDGYTYYRLKQVDKSGAFNYSPVISVVYKRGSSYAVFPNPAKEKFTLLIHAESETDERLELTDLSGKTISVKVIHLTPGDNTLEWDISQLANGLYILHAEHFAIPALKIIKE